MNLIEPLWEDMGVWGAPQLINNASHWEARGRTEREEGPIDLGQNLDPGEVNSNTYINICDSRA